MNDDDIYPSEEDLDKIRNWTWKEIPQLLEFLRERWMWANSGYWEENPELKLLNLHTGGWSGNESLIEALHFNTIVWVLIWEKSERGGHYTFDLSRIPSIPFGDL